MKRDPMDAKVALAMDMLAPEGAGEIIGGSQREDDHDLLLERILHENLSQQDFENMLSQPRREHTEFATLKSIFETYPLLKVFRSIIKVARKLGVKI